jgi:hypothetical protein
MKRSQYVTLQGANLFCAHKALTYAGLYVDWLSLSHHQEQMGASQARLSGLYGEAEMPERQEYDPLAYASLFALSTIFNRLRRHNDYMYSYLRAGIIPEDVASVITQIMFYLRLNRDVLEEILTASVKGQSDGYADNDRMIARHKVDFEAAFRAVRGGCFDTNLQGWVVFRLPQWSEEDRAAALALYRIKEEQCQ